MAGALRRQAQRPSRRSRSRRRQIQAACCTGPLRRVPCTGCSPRFMARENCSRAGPQRGLQPALSRQRGDHLRPCAMSEQQPQRAVHGWTCQLPLVPVTTLRRSSGKRRSRRERVDLRDGNGGFSMAPQFYHGPQTDPRRPVPTKKGRPPERGLIRRSQVQPIPSAADRPPAPRQARNRSSASWPRR